MGLETKPLSPKDIMDDLPNIIPPVVIEAVNNLLKKKFRGHNATIKLKEVKAEVRKLGGPSEKQLNDEKAFDFENVFRKQGWKVRYEQPSYGDSDFDAYYEFTPKK
jgi:hypothetical protein